MSGQFYHQKKKGYQKFDEWRKGPPQNEEMPLLPSYFDKDGNMLKEVFIGPPQKIAELLSRQELATKQLRDFHSAIVKARTIASLKGIEVARPLLWQCSKNLVYQQKRGVIKRDFVRFMQHHLSLAEKDEKNLEGFFQHIDSVVCYMPHDKGGNR